MAGGFRTGGDARKRVFTGCLDLGCVWRWAQVAEWLMAADCKSAVLWDYEGSNPSLCTSSWLFVGLFEDLLYAGFQGSGT